MCHSKQPAVSKSDGVNTNSDLNSVKIIENFVTSTSTISTILIVIAVVVCILFGNYTSHILKV